MGATGPMDEAKRRPHIDWTHTALVQGNAVRDYVKWDYQPTSIDGVPESFARAYSIMMTEPKGPIYMCYDAALQEAPKTHDVPLPPASAVADAVADGARPARASRRSPTSCSRPSTRCCCRNTPAGAPAASRASSSWPRLTGAAVWDVNNALNFPNKHPLCLSMDKPSLKHTDLIVGLDVKDWEKQLTELNNAKRIREFAAAAELRFRRDRLCRGRHQQMGDGLLPHAAVLGARARRHRARHSGADRASARSASRSDAEPARRRSPTARSRSASATTRSGRKWQEEARKDWDASPLTFPRLAHGGLGRHQGRGLGAHRQRPQAPGPQALGLRQAVPPSRRRARHLDPDRHLARRRAGAPRQEAASWSTSSPTAT